MRYTMIWFIAELYDEATGEISVAVESQSLAGAKAKLRRDPDTKNFTLTSIRPAGRGDTIITAQIR